jgi:hypothetical protein
VPGRPTRPEGRARESGADAVDGHSGQSAGTDALLEAIAAPGAMLSRYLPNTPNPVTPPRKHARPCKDACFRGGFARAIATWAIRESMAPSENNRCAAQRGAGHAGDAEIGM